MLPSADKLIPTITGWLHWGSTTPNSQSLETKPIILTDALTYQAQIMVQTCLEDLGLPLLKFDPNDWIDRSASWMKFKRLIKKDITSTVHGDPSQINPPAGIVLEAEITDGDREVNEQFALKVSNNNLGKRTEFISELDIAQFSITTKPSENDPPLEPGSPPPPPTLGRIVNLQVHNADGSITQIEIAKRPNNKKTVINAPELRVPRHDDLTNMSPPLAVTLYYRAQKYFEQFPDATPFDFGSLLYQEINHPEPVKTGADVKTEILKMSNLSDFRLALCNAFLQLRLLEFGEGNLDGAIPGQRFDTLTAAATIEKTLAEHNSLREPLKSLLLEQDRFTVSDEEFLYGLDHPTKLPPQIRMYTDHGSSVSYPKPISDVVYHSDVIKYHQEHRWAEEVWSPGEFATLPDGRVISGMHKVIELESGGPEPLAITIGTRSIVNRQTKLLQNVLLIAIGSRKDYIDDWKQPAHSYTQDTKYLLVADGEETKHYINGEQIKPQLPLNLSPNMDSLELERLKQENIKNQLNERLFNMLNDILDAQQTPAS